MKIEILIATKVWNAKPWVEGLSTSEHISKIHVWPTEADLSHVEALFVWKPLDEGVIQKLPNLKWISSLGAGVDHLVGDAQIPEYIPITRIVDPFLTRDMSNYVAMGVLMHQRSIQAHESNQARHHWDRIPYKNLKVGIMGLGELGLHCAKLLHQMGFEVYGWSRTKKIIEDIITYSTEQIDQFLENADVLVNLLPVTPKTENIINNRLLAQLPEGAYLINVARGNHLIEQDLIDALDRDHLSGALLDVFREEPLPEESPLWNHPKVTITPHVASVTSPGSAISLLLENIQRLQNEQPLLYAIDRYVGY